MFEDLDCGLRNLRKQELRRASREVRYLLFFTAAFLVDTPPLGPIDEALLRKLRNRALGVNACYTLEEGC